MVTPSGSCPAGSPAAAALAASENGHNVSFDLGEPAEAERYLTLAQDLCARAGLDPDTLVLLPFLG